MKSYFVLRSFPVLSVLQEFCILLLVLVMAFISVGFFLGVWVKMPRRNETEIRIAI